MFRWLINKIQFRTKFSSALRRVKLIGFRLSLSNHPEQAISIVTGSDHSHFESSLFLLNSIKRFEPSTQVFYFDLGLEKVQLVKLVQSFPSLTVIPFVFSDFPDWFNIRKEAGQYAWKPTAICLALQYTDHNLLWLDAGDLLVSPLTYVKRIIARDGIFIMQTSNSVGELTHPLTVSHFSAEDSISRLQLSAAIIGFARNNGVAMESLQKWRELSSIREIIAPPNSSRLNHRQDQAVLTLVLFGVGVLDRNIRRFLSWGVDSKSLGLLTHQDVE